MLPQQIGQVIGVAMLKYVDSTHDSRQPSMRLAWFGRLAENGVFGAGQRGEDR